jgi:DNA-binding transcriptional LysR family regulator
MELHQLRSFLMVAEEGHLGCAAGRLFVSPPAVSAHLKALEEELGVMLFERCPQGMVLTPSGRRLLGRARAVLDAARDLSTQAHRLKDEVNGELRVGVNHPATFMRTARMIARLAKVHPELRVTLSFGTCGAVEQAVAEGQLDAGFFDGPCLDRRLWSAELTRLNLRIVALRDWADDLAQPDWHVLESKPWAFVSPLCSYYRFMDGIFRRHRLKLPVRFQIDDNRTLLELVQGGHAMTVLPEEYLTDPALRRELHVWPHFAEKFPVSICCLRRRRDEPGVKAFIQQARQVWQESPRPPRNFRVQEN